jgi:Zn-dependent protease
MLFTLTELVDVVIISLALGFMFKDVFIRKVLHTDNKYDPIEHYSSVAPGFDSKSFFFAIMVTAPAILLHEFGHKFVALSFGATATFHAAYAMLGLGILLKLMNFGFIFFVPAFVAWSGSVSSLQAAAIAFAGPCVNLILWLASLIILKYFKPSHKYLQLLVLTKQINLSLFIFNMLPLPLFDGNHVFYYLIRAFLG